MNAHAPRSKVAAVALLSALLLLLVLGGTPSSAVTAAPVTLPDMVIQVPTDLISIGTSSGHRQLQFTHITADVGTGPFEIDPNYDSSTGTSTFTQEIYNSPSPGVWQPDHSVPVATTGIWHPPSDYDFPLTRFTLNEVNADGSLGAVVATSPKSDYCITGDTRLTGVANTPDQTFIPQSNCGDPTQPLGWSVGWGDQYDQTDSGQPIDLTGIQDGKYVLHAVVDPLHVLSESNPGNNVTDTELQITGTSVTVLSQSNPTTTPPTVSLTSPAAGTHVSGTLALSASASATTPASVSSVQFLLDGQPLGSPVTTPPYSYQWTVGSTAPGNHLLSARATDSDGNTATAATVAVVVDGPPTTGGGPAPAGGGSSHPVVTLRSLRWRRGVLTVVVTGLPKGARLSAELKFAHRRHRFVSTHHSRLQVRTRRPRQVVLRVFLGKRQLGKALTVTLGKPPTVRIINPVAKLTLSGTVPVYASASDDVAVSSVQFSLDGRHIGGPVTKAPFVIRWRTTRARSGRHRLSAVATNASGQRANTTVVVTVQNPAPPMTCFVLQAHVNARGQDAATTPGFHTVIAGETLFAFVSAAGPAGAGRQTATVRGGGLTWRLVKRANASAGDSEIWTARAPAILTGTQITSVLTTPGFDQSLSVIAMEGASGAGSAAGASGRNGAAHVRLRTRSGASLVFAVGNDSANAAAPTPSLGWVPLDAGAGAAPTFWTQYTNWPTGRAGARVKVTAPAAGAWNLAAVELVNSGD
jgi:hypothetical protein